jgi:transposase
MPKDNKNNRTYSKAQKDAMLAKLLPPNNTPVPLLSAETGIPKTTLSNWKEKALRTMSTPATLKLNKKTMTSNDKFLVVMETYTMSEHELSEYCRKGGLYAEDIKIWRSSCISSMDKEPEAVREIKEELSEEKKKIKNLEREINRKDKALAEAAALLVLQKKLKAFWEGEEN